MHLPRTLYLFSCIALGFANPLTTYNHARQANTFQNPVLWEDYPDLDVFRVGDVFYYSSSTFAFSPGAPVLKSYDLVNWTPVSHSVPTLNFGSKYNLNSATDRAYVKGIWASTLRYRASDDTFYWIGCVESSKTYIWTSSNAGASNNSGEVANWNWKAAGTLNKCYYDCGLLVDDDDTMYVVYGNTNITVAQLSKNGSSEVKSQVVYKGGSTYIEGSRMYKINGIYYIFVTKPASAEWVLKSKSPWGPYEQKVLVDSIVGPLPNAGYSHQGGVVNTKDDKWYYVAFMDSYPGGRIPVVAPLTFDSSGWPSLVKNSSGAWGYTYPMPVSTSETVPPPTGIDRFSSPSLSHEWEWNHNPDNSKWSLSSSGLTLKTATVTNDLFTARNTLTHRIIGPKSHGTFKLDISKMTDGDRAGAALFRDVAAYIGVHKSGSSTQLVMVNNLTLDSSWTTKSPGTVAATGPTLAADTTTVWLRVQADITPAFSGTTTTRYTTFWYSLDGKVFKQLGGNFSMTNSYTFFTGYRFAVFNFATRALGGEVAVGEFVMEKV
jgi:beta-xylosidase